MAKSSGENYNPIPEDIKKKLDRHQAWLEFSAAGGTPADLSNEKRLRGTNLSSYSLRGAILTNTDLKDSNLTGVDLTETTGLLPGQLAGADLTGAKLPPEILFTDALANVAEMSKNAGKYSIGLLAGSLYSLLTVGTATDLALLTNTGGSTLPIINTAMPMGHFCLLAPIILLSGFLFFHITMQRLWEALAELPAVLPDGRPLDQVSYPWLLNGLVRFHLPRLRSEAIPVGFTQTVISVITTWVVTPFVMICIWWLYIRVHNWVFTSIHITVIVLAVAMAFTTYRLMRRTLRRQGKAVDTWPERLRRPAWWSGLAAVGLLAFALWGLSWSAINGIPTDHYANDVRTNLPGEYRSISRYDPRRLVPFLSSKLYLRTTLNLTGGELSTKGKDYKETPTQTSEVLDALGDEGTDASKPPSPDEKEKSEKIRAQALAKLDEHNKSVIAELEQVRGADLTGLDLRFADLDDAFLEKADLTGTHFEGANFKGSNLRGVDMTQASSLLGADMQRAKLDKAGMHLYPLSYVNLTYAKLPYADLKGTYFDHVDFKEVDLTGADLTHVSLIKAKLYKADLHSATLKLAILTDADLTSAHLDGANLNSAHLEHANLEAAHLIRADLTNAYFKDANLTSAAFNEANLTGTHLTNASLIGANFTGAHLTGADFRPTKPAPSNFTSITVDQLLVAANPEEALLEPPLKQKLLIALKERKKNLKTGLWKKFESPEKKPVAEQKLK